MNMNMNMNASCLDLVAADVRGTNTDSTLALTRFIIQWIYMPTVVLLGVVSNIVSMIVLTRKEMFSSTNYYLAVLACCDILFLAGGMLCTMPKLLPALILCQPFMFLTSYFQVMTTYVSNLSVAIICCFTVERFIVIRWPMKGRVWCTRDKAKRIVLIAILLTFLIELPNLIFYIPELHPPRSLTRLYDKMKAWDCANATCANQSSLALLVSANSTVGQYQSCVYWKKTPTWLAIKYEIMIVATSWVTAMLFAFLPLVLLFVLNSYLIRSVLVARTERCQMTNNSYATASLVVPAQQYLLLASSCKGSMTPQQVKVRRENHNERKVTIMLIAVVLLFLACHLPNAFGLLYTTALERKYNGDIPKDLNNQRLIMNNIFNALTQLNAAANFILYSLLSKKFSQTMRRLLASAMGSLCHRRKFRNNEVSNSLTSLNKATLGSERTSFQARLSNIMRPSFSAVPHDNGSPNRASTTRHAERIPLNSNSQSKLLTQSAASCSDSKNVNASP